MDEPKRDYSGWNSLEAYCLRTVAVQNLFLKVCMSLDPTLIAKCSIDEPSRTTLDSVILLFEERVSFYFCN